MKRIGIYKVHTTSALTWLHDWLYRMATEELRTGYEVKDLSSHFSLGDFSLQEWLAEFPEEGAKIKEEDYDALRNMSDEMFKTKLNILLKMRGFAKGYLSDLYVNEKLLAIFTLSRYSIDLDQNPLIKNVLLDFPSISIKCYDVGEGKTQIVLYYFPELEKVVDQLWQDIPFEARGESASAVTEQHVAQLDSEEIWKPWFHIPDEKEYRQIIELWCKGKNAKEIAKEVFMKETTIHNIISSLRKSFPEARIPKDRGRKSMRF